MELDLDRTSRSWTDRRPRCAPCWRVLSGLGRKARGPRDLQPRATCLGHPHPRRRDRLDPPRAPHPAATARTAPSALRSLRVPRLDRGSEHGIPAGPLPGAARGEPAGARLVPPLQGRPRRRVPPSPELGTVTRASSWPPGRPRLGHLSQVARRGWRGSTAITVAPGLQYLTILDRWAREGSEYNRRPHIPKPGHGGSR